MNCQNYAVCSGNSVLRLNNGIISQGYYNLSNVTILSSGKFVFTASEYDMISGNYYTGNVVNYIKSISSSSVQSISSNFNTSITANLTGDDGQAYILPANVSISSQNLMPSPYYVSTSNGKATFNVWFTKSGNTTPNITALGLHSLSYNASTISVKQEVLKIVDFSSQTFYSTDSFSFKVGVYSNDSSTLESNHGPYNISVSLIPSGLILNNNWMMTTGGFANFTLNVATDNNYVIKVSCNDMSSITSVPFTVIDKLVNVTLASAFSQPFDSVVPLTFNVLDNHGSLFMRSTFVVLNCAQINPTSAQSGFTTNGIITFYGYFNNTGNNGCTVTATNNGTFTVSTTFTLTTTNSKINPDPKCVIGLSSTACLMCVNNTYLDSTNTCNCISNSAYNPVSNQCDCTNNYLYVNGFCIQCAYYFNPSQISATYSADYTSLIFTFANQVIQSTSSCDGIANLPLALSSADPHCNWDSYTVMRITFSRAVSGALYNISLDPTRLTQVGTECYLNVSALSIPVTRTYPLPVPVALIYAPSAYSVSCGTNDLYVYVPSVSISSDYTYTWSSIVTPANSLISNYIATQTSNSFYISKSILTNSTITLLLNITSKTFGTWSSANATISVLSELFLGVVISLGNKVSIKQTDSISLNAKVPELCGATGDFAYSWTVSNPSVNMTALLAQSKRPDSLFITAGFLSAGSSYVFTVTVTSGTLSGTASVNVDVISSPLTIELNKGSGTIGTDYNLTITATVNDPDNVNSLISYLWTCKEGPNPCLNSQNLTLFSSVSGPVLNILNTDLRNGAVYSFVVNASTSVKFVTSEVDLKISSLLKGYLSLPAMPGVINGNTSLTIAPSYVTTNLTPSFEWSFTPAISSSVSIALDLPYLVIPANYLTPGVPYTLTLNMSSLQGGSLIAYTVITASSPPVCDSFSVTAESDNYYTVTGSNCHEVGSTSLLTYQYGSIRAGDSTYRWNSLPLYNTPVTIRYSKKITTALLRVCDNLNNCVIYSAPLPKSSRFRQLTILDDYYSSIIDPDHIPSSVIYYSDSITNQTTFDAIYASMYGYFETVSKVDLRTIDVLLTCASDLFTNSSFGNSSSTSNVTALIYQLLSEYNSSIGSSEVSQALDIVSQFGPQIDSSLLANLLSLLGNLWISGSSTNTTVEYQSNITLFRYRDVGSHLIGSNFTFASSNLTIPADFPINNNSIYDFQFSRFFTNSDHFEVSLFDSGSYINYNLNLSSPVSTEVIPVSPINVQIQGQYDPAHAYQCLILIDGNWQTGPCSIHSVTDNYISLDIMHESQFEVIPSTGGSCSVGRGPIATMSLIVFLWLLFALIFFIVDKKTLKMPAARNNFLLHYPLTSIWISQVRPRRVAVATQLFTSELLMLALIGAFMNYFDDPTQDSSANFNDYYGRQLSRGAAAWAMTQAFTIPIFFLNAYGLNTIEVLKFSIYICIVIILCCIGAIIAMTTQYCSGYTQYWIVNFLIFLLFDLLTLEVIYAVIASFIFKGPDAEMIPTAINTPRAKDGHFRSDSAGKTSRNLDQNPPEGNESYYEIIYSP